MDRNRIQKYINNYRRQLTRYLRPGFGLLCNVYPAKNGAILEFVIGNELANDDIYHPERNSVGDALGQIEQRAFGGNLSGFTFSGTNTILENNRLIYIKDSTSKEWGDKAVKKDVNAVLPNSSGRK
ncbi:hypothetical protein [Vibrio splendidus]|uniref:hypothetical protein n=1 Tax=Vibrio splendidus TaxID=29497 RepID=UPI000C85E1B2|nr:hypothetical protein [Vibrio splendidus]PMP42103.1 hypothetical protein BCS86_14730 [Vibrio splendidus]